MATIRFRGDAPPVTQVVTVTPANVEIGDRFTLTINGKSVSFTATAATVANVTAGLTAALEATSLPEFAEIAASDETTQVRITSRTPGLPFVVSTSTANGGGSGGQSLTLATSSAASGPEHWNDPNNWSGGAVPASGDDVYLEHSAVHLKYGLDQAAVDLASLHIAASFTGEIGLPERNENETDSYAEYRPQYLAIGAARVTIGGGQGRGSSRLQLDTGSSATNIVVMATGLPQRQESPAVLWRGVHAANTLNVRGGSVGVAHAGGDLATLAQLRASGGEVYCGSGASLDAVACAGQAHVWVEASVSHLTQSGGRVVLVGAGEIGEATLSGGRLDYRSSGAIGLAIVDGPTAILDFSGDAQPRSVAACTLKRGAIADPHGSVSWTTGIQIATSVQAV